MEWIWFFGLISGGLSVSLSSSPCYKPKPANYRNSRIVGGSDAVQNETPYMVGLMKHGGVVCGASIISENFLILAAHCVCNHQNNFVKPTQLRAYVGMYKVSDVKENREVSEVIISRIIAHPGYVCGKKAGHDIALLHLKHAIKFDENIKPLCIAPEEPTPETVGIVTGWGWTNEDFSLGEKPNVLQTVEVPIWSNDECQMSYRNMMKPNEIISTQMCAGGREGGMDSCWADSGGPLINKATGELIGIVSTGVGCARKGLPGIYTRVVGYDEWIREHVGNL